MIKLGIDGVVKDASQAKVGIGGVVRNVSGGYGGVAGVVRQFFGNLTGISFFKIALVNVWYKTTSDSEFVTLSKPTTFGTTTYNLSPNPCELTIQENGYISLKVGSSMSLILQASIYCIFSNGASSSINNLFKNSSSAITINGTSSYEAIGNVSNTLLSPNVLGNVVSISEPWTITSLGSDNPYGIYIKAQVFSETNTSIGYTLESIGITVDGVSYPMKIVL